LRTYLVSHVTSNLVDFTWDETFSFVPHTYVTDNSVQHTAHYVLTNFDAGMVLPDKLRRCLSLFFVGHAFRNETLESCLFSIKRRLPISAECSNDILSWFLPLIDMTLGVAKFASYLPFSGIFPSVTSVLPLLGIIFHTLASIILQWSYSVHSNQSSLDSRYIYAFNPVVLLSCLLSPVPSLLHLLLSLASYSALKGWGILLSICLAVLVMGHFEFIYLVPAYINLIRRVISIQSKAAVDQNSTVTRSKHIIILIAQHFCRAAISFLVLYLALVLCCDCFDLFGIVSYRGLMDPVTSLIDRTTHYLLSIITSIVHRKKLNFEPTVNVSWYLDVQTFIQFSDYISLLTASQPLLFFLPFMLRFSNLKPLHTVRTLSMNSSSDESAHVLLPVYTIRLNILADLKCYALKHVIGQPDYGDRNVLPPRNSVLRPVFPSSSVLDPSPSEYTGNSAE
jgi:GPI transamidase subunit PIG-U